MLYPSKLRGCLSTNCLLRLHMAQASTEANKIPLFPNPKDTATAVNKRDDRSIPSTTSERNKVVCSSSSDSVGAYIPPNRRLRSVIGSTSGTLLRPRSFELDNAFLTGKRLGFSSHSCGYYSNEEPDRYHNTQCTSVPEMNISTYENVVEWRGKLNMLFHNNANEQEVLSWEKKDRRDYVQLAEMASKMGLFSRQYAKVIVFSKVPLPNYRSDLDIKRPRREVSISPVLQGEVGYLLQQYLSHKKINRDNLSRTGFSKSSSNDSFVTDGGQIEEDIPTSPNNAVEKLLFRKSEKLLNQQRYWQESPEGKRMLEFRQGLPAYKERDAVLEAIAHNQVIIISGETGCGKTTQIPQYILESEIDAIRGAVCSIVCTEPRRIAAITVSERVAAERGENLGESVGYKVRLEGVKGRDTHLLFCTTGILLRRLLVDRNLKGVTHVIIDEIHERGMNEDFLLIVLKALLPNRPELKLILMSATLNAELFSSYFDGAPMLHIPGFTFPVRTYFLETALEMTGHRLTPYNQIDDYGQEKTWKKKKQADRKRKSPMASVVERALAAVDFQGYSLRTLESLACWNPDSIGFNLIESVLVHICRNERSGAVLVFMTGWDDINSLKDQLQAHPFLGDTSNVLLLTCHSSMDSSEQKLIFDKPEDGVRKIVLATNMAETSITINDVVFVVDCGKAKETSYDALNNTPCLLPSWISKASALQRRGRAGRVQPGECYHLYPKCVFDVFSEFQLPELLRTPLQSLCLQIKSLHLGSISQFLSKALQSPELLSVQNAVEYLKVIGALDENEEFTVLGWLLSTLPVEPKLGKMLIYGAIFNCLDPILTIVAGLSSKDPFLMPFDKKDLVESAKSQFSCQDYSDQLTLVRAFNSWKEAESDHSGYEFCWKNFLSVKTLKAIESLRKQFVFLLKDSGLVDNLADCNKWSTDQNLVRAIICAGLYPGVCSVINKEKSISLKTMEDGQVMLHSNSVNGRVSNLPYPWLVFNEKVKVNTVFIRDSTAVSDSVLLLFGGDISRGGLDGHLQMLDGYLEFYMKYELSEIYLKLKTGIEEFVNYKLMNPRQKMNKAEELLSVVRLLLTDDSCCGRFTFGEQEVSMKSLDPGKPSEENIKCRLQTVLLRGGHDYPSYRTRGLGNNHFQSTVEFNGMQFSGQSFGTKKLAEKDAAREALNWLNSSSPSGSRNFYHLSMKHRRML